MASRPTSSPTRRPRRSGSRSKAGGRLPALAEPIDPGQRRLAERRLLAALRRHQRRTPLSPDLRVDALIAQLHAAEPAHRSGHRGQQPLALSDAELRAIVDAMVAEGALDRTGHRVRLPGDERSLDPVMRGRVDELLATVTAAGAQPPPTEALAARLGIPSALLAQLRASGELVSLAPRIDLSRQSWRTIASRLDRLAVNGPLSVSAVRDDLGTARRFAEAILQRWNRLRSEQ